MQQCNVLYVRHVLPSLAVHLLSLKAAKWRCVLVALKMHAFKCAMQALRMASSRMDLFLASAEMTLVGPCIHLARFLLLPSLTEPGFHDMSVHSLDIRRRVEQGGTALFLGSYSKLYITLRETPGYEETSFMRTPDQLRSLIPV